MPLLALLVFLGGVVAAAYVWNAVQVGELCVHGYSVMLGYWADAPATARSFDAVRRRHFAGAAAVALVQYC